MKKIYLVIIFTFLLTNCGNNNYKTIILRTTGSVETEPNEANILLHISCTNKNIEKAKNCIINKSDELISDLNKFEIEGKDILTTRIDLSKDYVWRNNSNIFNGYKASTSINIHIQNLKILDDLYTKLLSNSNITLNSLNYSHNKLDSLNELAYLKALENANNLAEKILSQLPEHNKLVTKISNMKISQSNNDDVITENEANDFRESDKPKMSVNIGNMIVEQQLYVEFKIY